MLKFIIVVLSLVFFNNSIAKENSKPNKIKLTSQQSEKVAIIAISAYKQYSLRAKIMTKLKSPKLKDAEIQIENYFSKHQDFPSESKITAFAENDEVFSYESHKGQITIKLLATDDNVLAGEKLYLIPKINGRSLMWQCKSTLQREYLPTNCR